MHRLPPAVHGAYRRIGSGCREPSARATDDQFDRQELLRLHRLTGHHSHQRPRREVADPARGNMDGRQAGETWADMSSPSMPMTLRSSGTAIPRAWASSRQPIAKTSMPPISAVGRSSRSSSIAHPAAPGEGQRLLDDEGVRQRKASLFQRLPSAGEPGPLAIVELCMADDHADAAVSEADQMLRRQTARHRVVDGDGGKMTVAAPGQDHRKARAAQQSRRLRRPFGPDQHQAVDTASEQSAHRLRLGRWAGLVRGDEQQITRLGQRCLHRLEGTREDGAVECGDNRADRHGSARGERPRRAIGQIAEALGTGPDPGERVRREQLGLRDGTRHRGSGYAGIPGHIAQLDARSAHRRPHEISFMLIAASSQGQQAER